MKRFYRSKIKCSTVCSVISIGCPPTSFQMPASVFMALPRRRRPPHLAFPARRSRFVLLRRRYATPEAPSDASGRAPRDFSGMCLRIPACLPTHARARNVHPASIQPLTGGVGARCSVHVQCRKCPLLPPPPRQRCQAVPDRNVLDLLQTSQKPLQPDGGRAYKLSRTLPAAVSPSLCLPLSPSSPPPAALFSFSTAFPIMLHHPPPPSQLPHPRPRSRSRAAAPFASKICGDLSQIYV